MSFEDDWLSISPLALPSWQQLSLKPYSGRMQIEYIAVVPENPQLKQHTTHLMQELSATFRSCELGSHEPYIKDASGGIFTAKKTVVRVLFVFCLFVCLFLFLFYFVFGLFYFACLVVCLFCSSIYYYFFPKIPLHRTAATGWKKCSATSKRRYILSRASFTTNASTPCHSSIRTYGMSMTRLTCPCWWCM